MAVIRVIQVAVEVLRPSDPGPTTGSCSIGPYTVSGDLANALTDGSSVGDIVLADVFGESLYEVHAVLASGAMIVGAVEIPKRTINASAVGPTSNGDVEVPARTVNGVMISQGLCVGDITIGFGFGTPWAVLGTMSGGEMTEGDIQIGSVFEPPFSVNGTMISENFSEGNVSCDAYTLEGSLEPALPLPEYVVDGTMLPGTVAESSIIMRVRTMSGAMEGGNIATGGDLTLETFDVVGEIAGAGGVVLNEYDVSGSVISGAAMAGAIVLAERTLAAEHIQDGFAAGDATLPLFSITATSSGSTVIVGSVTLPKATASGRAVAGTVMSGSITVPLLEVDAEGFADIVGEATIELPVYAVAGSIVSELLAPVFTSIALNSATNAVTLYDNISANSMCMFEGLVLMATADGIVALTGDTDNGDAIDAHFTVGTTDYGSPQLKRVSSGYVGGRMDGKLEITLFTDKGGEFSYTLTPRDVGGLHQARQIFGKGLRSRYYAWRVANKNGCDFELDNVALDVDILSRRV